MKILKWIGSVVLLAGVALSTANAATVPVLDGYDGPMDAGNTYLAESSFTTETWFQHTFVFTATELLSAYVELGNYSGTPGIDNFTATWDGADITGLGSSFTAMITAATHTLIISGNPKYSVTDPTNLPSYNIGVAVSAVPVPAALWLFGSALVAFVGFGRRSTSA